MFENGCSIVFIDRSHFDIRTSFINIFRIKKNIYILCFNKYFYVYVTGINFEKNKKHLNTFLKLFLLFNIQYS